MVAFRFIIFNNINILEQYRFNSVLVDTPLTPRDRYTRNNNNLNQQSKRQGLFRRQSN